MHLPHLLLSCCVALSLTACAISAPPATPVAPTLPPQWQAPLPHNASLGDLAQWWQSLGDPLLVQLVAAAQEASPTVASAQSRVSQSRAARTIAGAALLPTLDASANGQRSANQAALPVTSTLAAGLLASWEIDLFGANRLAADAAQARLESAQALWHDARVSVAAEVARVYFNQRACELQLLITQADADSRAQTSRLNALSTQAGFTAPATAALARASAAEARGRASEQRSLCELDIKALVALTAVPEAELRQQLVAAPRDLAPGATLAIASVPAQALGQRPDLYSAERDIAAASAEASSVDAQRYPRLALNGSIGALAYRAGGASNSMSTWSIGPLSLSVPLLDGGRRNANLQAAQARYDEAVFVYRARARQAVREVEEALVRLQGAAARSDDAATADQGYRAWLAATEARYTNGLASLVELEETRRTALAAASSLLALRREQVQAWIALYRAVGGGWAPPQPTAASQ